MNIIMIMLSFIKGYTKNYKINRTYQLRDQTKVSSVRRWVDICHSTDKLFLEILGKL